MSICAGRPQGPPFQGMATFGDILRDKRQGRGIALDEVAKATRIRRQHLEALERGDLGSLPGGAFSKGFVRAYAEFLGLDADIVVREYVSEESRRGSGMGDGDQEMLKELSRRLGTGAKIRLFPSQRRLAGPLRTGAVSLAVVIAMMGGWLWVQKVGPGRGMPPTKPAPDARPATPPASEATSADTAPAPAVRKPETAPGPLPQADTEPSPSAAAKRPAEPAPKAPMPSQEPAETKAALPPARSVERPSPPAALPQEAVGAVASDLTVSESGVGTGVVRRRLVGRRSEFPEGGRVWFWTLTQGGRRGDVVRHVWIHDGRPVDDVRLRVGGHHWRTYTRRQLAPGSAGPWTVEARDAQGRVLATELFFCVPP